MGLVQTEEVGSVLIASFNEAKILDEAKIQKIGNELAAAADSAAAEKKLLLNFSGVQFMSSAMIGKLVLLNKKCAGKEIDLKMCSISPNVYEVFKIMKLNKVFDLHKDLEKALKAFNKKGWFG